MFVTMCLTHGKVHLADKAVAADREMQCHICEAHGRTEATYRIHGFEGTHNNFPPCL